MFIKSRCIAWLLMLTSLLISPNAYTDSDKLESLLKMDIHELMELPVLMPSRNLERQFDASSAIYVITQEDIRRSGLTRIPELLRMVPGLTVARLDNNTWAVSSRSNVSRLNNSMLVLLDGRTLYNPLFGGVYWDIQDLFLDDVDRIEVIRGPGGSLWGSNAVNGIINIITKSSNKTAYSTLYAGIGKGETKYNTGIRIGQTLNSDVSGRIYVKAYQTDQGEYLNNIESTNNGFFTPGSDAHDDGKNKQSGFRLDWSLDSNSSISFIGDTYDGEFHNIRTSSPMENTVKANGSNIVVKWQNRFSEKSDISMQFYIDHTKRKGFVFDEERKVYDLDFQHSLKLASNEITWGAGIRHNKDNTQKTPQGVVELVPNNHTDTLVSFFIQDRITIVKDKILLTFGSKFGENDFTGGEIQPSIRLLWKIDQDHTFWSSVTRAVRIPNRYDLHARLHVGGPPIDIGNPNAQTESVIATEIGYRSQHNSTTLLDLTAFNHNYSDPNIDSIMLGRTYGLELNLKHKFSNNWRTETSYTWHKGHETNNGSKTTNERLSNSSITVRSLYDINKQWEFDTFLTYKEAYESTSALLEDYIRVDIRLGVNPYPHSRSSFSITNLFNDEHAEASDSTRVNTMIGRAVYFSTTYDFH